MDNKKIAIIALLFAFVGITGAAVQQLSGVTCFDCVLDSPTFVNYTFPVRGNSFDDIHVNSVYKNDTTSDEYIRIMNPLLLNARLYNPNQYGWIHLTNSSSDIHSERPDGSSLAQLNVDRSGTIQFYTINYGTDRHNSFTTTSNRIEYYMVEQSSGNTLSVVKLTDSEWTVGFNSIEKVKVSDSYTNITNNFTVSGLSGTGNAYVCVDSNGFFYRNSSCG